MAVPGVLPRHVAIIMDGNGRWASKRLLPRAVGHVRGVNSVQRVIEDAQDIGLEYLTLYAFSTENWRRPVTEIRHLMDLVRRYFEAEMEKFRRDNVRVRIIGTRDHIDPDIAEMVNDAERQTEKNTGFNLTFAFNYGGREELVAAARALVEKAARGEVKPEDVTPDAFANELRTRGIPDPDLVIRTGGESRISNFLLWQAAYAEFIFADTLWPDFRRQHLIAALTEYAKRERRFGGVKEKRGVRAAAAGAPALGADAD
jgi:undecaprenyl diphosphate synthase